MIDKVNRLIIRISKREGQVVPISEVIRLAENEEGISEKDVRKTIKELTERGMIVKLDEDTVQVTAS